MRLELIRDFSHWNHNPVRLPISSYLPEKTRTERMSCPGFLYQFLNTKTAGRVAFNVPTFVSLGYRC